MRNAMAVMVLVGVGGVGAAEAAPPCQPEGQWEVSWKQVKRDLPLRSLEGFTLVVTGDGAEVDGGFDPRAPGETTSTARIDRKRCTASVTLRAGINFADDAGHQDETMRLTIGLRGPSGAVRGRLVLEEELPWYRRRTARVVGEARRVEGDE